jgi:hypothetical protein
VDAMVYKLKIHHKKGRWEDLDLNNALIALEAEVQELRAAIALGNSVEILTEAADVANFAMIIAAISTERGQ